MKMKTKITILFLMMIMTVIITGGYVLSVTKSQLQDDSAKIKNEIAEKEDEINEIGKKLSTSVKEVQDLMSQISTYENAISELNNKIDTVSSEINETENNINQKEKDLNDKQALLDKRLVAMYETGNTSYIDLLLSSEDITDFISKYYLISEIAEYDTDLMEKIRAAKAELEVAKANLETNKANLETTKQEQVDKQQTLKNLQAQKQQKVNALNAEEKEAQHELEILEADKKEVDSKIAEMIRKEEEEEEARRKAQSGSGSGSTAPVAPSACGYIFPVQGLSRANINNKNYPSYPGHTGVDVNINVTGKSVVAVKDGTVEISEAMRSSSGAYRSYGEYVVINHHDGTRTLYAHMLSGSRKVSPGQKVSQGQVIGTVGSTGNSTGNHLHFEVRVGLQKMNPMLYLP